MVANECEFPIFQPYMAIKQTGFLGGGGHKPFYFNHPHPPPPKKKLYIVCINQSGLCNYNFIFSLGRSLYTFMSCWIKEYHLHIVFLLY